MFGSVLAAIIAVFILAVPSMAQHADMPGMEQRIAPIAKAIAVLIPTSGNNVQGIVTFTKVADGITVTAHIEHLTPGKNGFHIHEFGDCSSPDGMSAGGHFNPMNMQHGAPTDANRHEGDIGNIVADSSGVANLEWLDKMLSFEGPYSIIGRSVVVHANEDDLKSQPTGNAGARLACGAIGIAK